MAPPSLPLHEGRPPGLISTVALALEYEVLAPSHLCFMVQALQAPGRQQVLSESLHIEPPLPLRPAHLPGGSHRAVRLDAPPGRLSLAYGAQVALWPAEAPAELAQCPVTQLPDALLADLLPSRYCESDALARLAQQTFGTLAPGLARVQAIDEWIYRSLQYLPGVSDSLTGAKQVVVQRAGVCRDFAHLGIALCRALNIPARMVVGYVHFNEPPEDFHAVFEAWLGGQWVLFDPTRMAPTERLVRIATGRDAKDVAFATFFGNVRMRRKHMAVHEAPVAPQHRMPGP